MAPDWFVLVRVQTLARGWRDSYQIFVRNLAGPVTLNLLGIISIFLIHILHRPTSAVTSPKMKYPSYLADASPFWRRTNSKNWINQDDSVRRRPQSRAHTPSPLIYENSIFRDDWIHISYLLGSATVDKHADKTGNCLSEGKLIAFLETVRRRRLSAEQWVENKE